MPAGEEPAIPPANIPKQKSLGPPLFLWLLVQLAGLALAVARVPLAAHFPEPVERLAVGEVLVAQVLGLAMLFPILLRDWLASLAVAASMWPMLLVANLLSDAPLDRVLLAGGYVSLWLAALNVWRTALKSAWSQMIGVSIFGLFAAGGPVLWYLGLEFGSGTSLIAPDRLALFIPTLICPFLLREGNVPALSWLFPACVFGLGAFYRAVVNRKSE